MDISGLLSAHRMNPGDAVRHLEGFATELASLGYASLTINEFLTSAIHFGGWLQAGNISLAEVGEQTVSAFAAHRCRCPGSKS